MPKEFDLYLVNVEWESENRIRNFTPSNSPLEPSGFTGNTYRYDTVIYNKIINSYYQVAIKSKYTPIIKNNDNAWELHNQLHRVNDYFWIIKGDWRTGQAGSKYHHCPSQNTVGKIEIGLTNDLINIQHIIEVDVNPNIEDFDFEILKDDFEGELWSLVTSNSSKARAETRKARFGDKIFCFTESQSIIAFIHEFEKIVKTPKLELKHDTSNLPFEKVKPIPATFKKIAVAGTDVLLPSKIHVENFDNYENRYLCLMLYKISQIVNYNLKFSIRQANRLRSEITSMTEKIGELQKPQILNKEQVVSEMRSFEEFYSRWLENWNRQKNIAISKCSNSDCRVNFIFEIAYQSDIYNYWGKKDGTYCLISFPVPMENIFEPQKNQQVKIKCYCYQDGMAGRFPRYEVRAIEKIELISINYQSIINKQKSNYFVLEKNDWKNEAILNATERNKMQLERTNQVATLQRKIQKIEEQITSLGEFENEIQQFKPYLLKLLNTDFVKKINFKKLTHFKPSMTYIQNNQYRNALKYYQEILNTEGIDINVFGLYEQTTEYGIREMPQVFELWSLITVIKVLENTFNFKHNPGDLKLLLKSISPNNKRLDEYVKINFSGNLNGRSVILHYQKVLSNYKRPDLILEISCEDRNIFIVLDAKFKNYNYKLSATYETQSMIEKYKVNSDYFVFILHPCKDLEKGEYITKLTNFGGEKVYLNEGQISFPFHKFGYLMIKPSQTDNIKKVIGMSLEYLIENAHNAKQSNNTIDPVPQYEMICIGCGGDKVTKSQSTRGATRHHYTCKCQNQDCEHNIYIDYCWNCKTKLFKHGSYWDYHRTSVWSIFDIHCPNCGMTVADRPTVNYNEY